MKRSLLLIALSLASFLISACGAQTAQEAWKVYQAAGDTPVNPEFPSYSFEYPSYWRMEEGVNHLTFASEAKLLKDPPETLKPGQIITTLSTNINMPPEEMVESYTSGLGSIIQFQETVFIRLNGRPVAYQQGINSTACLTACPRRNFTFRMAS